MHIKHTRAGSSLIILTITTSQEVQITSPFLRLSFNKYQEETMQGSMNMSEQVQ